MPFTKNKSLNTGLSGIRDQGLLRSALDRPKNIAAYEPDGNRDLARLAAAYGHGIAKNHPFVDGNKRTALVVTEAFLNLNGLDLTADDATCVAVMRAVADGTMKEDTFARWIQENIKPIEPPLKPQSNPAGER